MTYQQLFGACCGCANAANTWMGYINILNIHQANTDAYPFQSCKCSARACMAMTCLQLFGACCGCTNVWNGYMPLFAIYQVNTNVYPSFFLSMRCSHRGIEPHPYTALWLSGITLAAGTMWLDAWCGLRGLRWCRCKQHAASTRSTPIAHMSCRWQSFFTKTICSRYRHSVCQMHVTDASPSYTGYPYKMPYIQADKNIYPIYFLQYA